MRDRELCLEVLSQIEEAAAKIISRFEPEQYVRHLPSFRSIYFFAARSERNSLARLRANHYTFNDGGVNKFFRIPFNNKIGT